MHIAVYHADGAPLKHGSCTLPESCRHLLVQASIHNASASSCVWVVPGTDTEDPAYGEARAAPAWGARGHF